MTDATSERYNRASQALAGHWDAAGGPSTNQPRHASGSMPPSDWRAVTDVRGRCRPYVFNQTYATATHIDPPKTAVDPRNDAWPDARASAPKMTATPATPAESASILRVVTRSEPSSQ